MPGEADEDGVAVVGRAQLHHLRLAGRQGGNLARTDDKTTCGARTETFHVPTDVRTDQTQGTRQDN